MVVSTIFYFHPGKWSILTNIFQRGWNHQLVVHLPLGLIAASVVSYELFSFCHWKYNNKKTWKKSLSIYWCHFGFCSVWNSKTLLGGGVNYFCFYPYLGRWSKLAKKKSLRPTTVCNYGLCCDSCWIWYCWWKTSCSIYLTIFSHSFEDTLSREQWSGC